MKDEMKPESIRQSAFFTGHRLLRNSDLKMIGEKVFQCISDAYDSGFRRFYCGCARGFDMLAAFETLRLRETHPDVILSLAIPCETQAERWNRQEREKYSRILELADEKAVLSPVYYQGVMLVRNRYMADRSSLCICWLTHMSGGTASAVSYAMQNENMKVINLAVPGNGCQH